VFRNSTNHQLDLMVLELVLVVQVLDFQMETMLVVVAAVVVVGLVLQRYLFVVVEQQLVAVQVLLALVLQLLSLKTKPYLRIYVLRTVFLSCS